jgi:hypothetical protein
MVAPARKPRLATGLRGLRLRRLLLKLYSIAGWALAAERITNTVTAGSPTVWRGTALNLKV